MITNYRARAHKYNNYTIELAVAVGVPLIEPVAVEKVNPVLVLRLGVIVYALAAVHLFIFYSLHNYICIVDIINNVADNTCNGYLYTYSKLRTQVCIYHRQQ